MIASVQLPNTKHQSAVTGFRMRLEGYPVFLNPTRPLVGRTEGTCTRFSRIIHIELSYVEDRPKGIRSLNEWSWVLVIESNWNIPILG